MTGKTDFVKMSRGDLSPRAQRLNRDSIFVDIHNHMMFEYAIHHALGRTDIFDTCYAPGFRQGGINVIATSVGGNSPCVCNMTDDLVHGCLEQIDMLMEAEQSSSFRICKSTRDIEQCVSDDKIAIILAMEGARALEGIDSEESLVLLRTFYRLGLRTVCIVGGARTRFGDGMGEDRANAGLTTFGVKLIKEMERLGILVDLTHMTERTFFNAMDTAQKPVLVSHIGAQAICPNPNNLSDDRIRAIGQNGGVIGMEIVKTEVEWEYDKKNKPVTWDNVIRHIDHIAGLIGIDHVGIGLDYDNFHMVHNIHRAMCPAPGSIEGFYTGVPLEDHMLEEPNSPSEAWVIAEYMVRHGFSDEEIEKVMGKNLMRLFKETIG